MSALTIAPYFPFPRCGMRTERLEFLSPVRRCTVRFERVVADLCRVVPIQHAAAHFGLGWHTPSMRSRCTKVTPT